jgi:hypothetical protein
MTFIKKTFHILWLRASMARFSLRQHGTYLFMCGFSRAKRGKPYTGEVK